MQTDTDVLELFKKAAWEVDQKKLDRIEMDEKISSLGIDSVAMLEVIGFFEEELDIHLPDERLARVETVRDLADLIKSLRSAA
jgi:acyl carrier protein